MPTLSDVFGNDLQPDPAYVLHPVAIPIHKRAGPMPRLQFVIEFVGPRTVSAGSAAALLTPEWSSALGHPQAFAMSAADIEWQPLTTTSLGSYDSLALAWDLRSDQGQLSKQTAQHLLATAEQYAQHIQRRAMAMPVPEDVPKAIAQLKQVQDNFDAGVTTLVLPNSREVSEFELWVWCAKLGLTPNISEGSFDWIVPGSPLALFSVSPIGETDSFSLEGAQRGDKHDGVILGFNVPMSPEPVAGFDAMLLAADFLAGRMPGQVFDEDNCPLSESSRRTIRTELVDAVATLNKLGFPPGSAESLVLFES